MRSDEGQKNLGQLEKPSLVIITLLLIKKSDGLAALFPLAFSLFQAPTWSDGLGPP